MLIIGHFLTELHSFVYSEKLLNTELDLFLCPTFHYKLSVIWYLKLLSESLLTIIIFFVAAQLAKEVNLKMFYVLCIYLFYHVCDFFSFIWNYKETAEMYWVLLLCTTVSTLLIIFVKPKKMRAV